MRCKMEKLRWLITSSVSLAIAIVLLLIFSGGAQALMLKMTLEELTAGADSVLVGTVVSSTSNWNADHTNIYTEVVVSITDVLKGDTGENTVTVILPGGTVGETWQWVEDQPVFKVGENAGLFLEELNSAGLARMGLGGMPQLVAGSPATVYGGFQGKMSFTEDNSGTLSRISPDEFKQNVSLALSGQPVPEVQNVPSIMEVISNQTISGINPNIASAGTNSLVTLTGSGFGTKGSNDHLVFYFLTSGSTDWFMYDDSQIVSWSDTQIQGYVPIDTIPGDYPYSACSGPVAVYKNGSWGNLIPITVTFGYGQYKWPGTGPTVTYRINDGGVAGRLAAVQSAANTWVNASANFSFSYGGTTSATTKSQNGVNEILWEDLPAGTVGQTYGWGSGGTITECDTSFNTDYVWNTAVTCPAGQYDVPFIGTHEIGHWLNLRDLYGPSLSFPAIVTL